MAECMAARLAVQERQIAALNEEVGRLRDALSGGGGGSVGAAVINGSGLEELRSENEKLRYRLVHLRRALHAQPGHETPRALVGARSTGRESNNTTSITTTHKVCLRKYNIYIYIIKICNKSDIRSIINNSFIF